MDFAALWPHWLRPWSLLLLPLCAWLLWHLWHRERRSGRWQLLLPTLFQSALLTGGRTQQNRLPWIALGLGWLLAILALLGPSWQRMEQASQKRADPLVVMLELTPAMLAGDAAPDRLSQAKRKLLDLLHARQDAQTAILVYAGSAHTLVPLSDDLATASNLLDALKPSIMPEPGRRADVAMSKAINLLEQGAQGRGRLLLITSELSQDERSGIQRVLGKRGEQLRILGIGTTQGAPILGEDGSFLKDAQGAILLPRLDAAGLKRFASELGGQYRQASLDDRDLRGLGLFDGPQSLREDGEPTQLTTWADQGHWLLLPLLLLAACAGRRGWLFCLPLLLALPQPSYAFEFRDLWLRPDQQGQRLLQADKPKEAAERFADPQWQGEALYRAGDYPAAAERFAQSDSASAHYNRGNALAKSNELEAALDAYEQALEQQPDLHAAQQNKTLVEQLLLQQKQQQQQQQQSGQEGEPQEPGSEQPQSGSPGQQQPSSGEPQSQPDGEDAAEQPAAENPAKPGEQQSDSPAQKPDAGNSENQTQAAQDSDTDEAQAGSGQALGDEQRDALEQWLRQIPDEPGELLRRKFLYEQQQRQEQSR
ncbi:VWA domain-containing protein [Aquipseudomonas guryensis]|uniref:VWA domain-containing protein n=1 Tax=Aquipseudomonas guryensis TaxID=2759165 RepID=A0A7W4DEL9_9GAMM|nr:VWA domain-containing protein [Pseudomonas guryensis]MBB1520867.1 VWA domain-containing protein [Pseudomonas guryensis]